MLILNQLGLGNLRPYFTAILFAVLFSFVGMNDAYSQIDISIDIVGAPAPMGESIKINPNPISNYGQVQYQEDIQLESLTILNQSGEVMAVLNLSQSSNFEVSLPSGVSSWVFHTSAGIISKQILITGQ